MNKKNILIFIDWFLPGTRSGGPVRSYANLIEHLKEDFNFYIITRNTDYCSDEIYQNVQSNSWNTFSKNTQVYYLSKDQTNFENIKHIVSEIEGIDTVYINGIYSWYFSILPVFLFRKKYTTMVSARGMLNPQAFSVKGFKKKLFLTLAKSFSIYNKVFFHATNDQEKKHIQLILGNKLKVKVAPNLPRPLLQEFQPKHKNETITFANVARVSIEKGTLKMIKAFQGVTHNVILDIYGPIYDEDYWEQCQESIQLLPQNIIVNYKGSIDSELIPNILKQYNFFILLSEGENFGHAILEGLSAGCPVIISNKTPWQELISKNIGWDLNINKENEITKVLNEIGSMTDECYVSMSRNAFKYAKSFCEDPNLIEQNKQLFKS